MQPDELLVVRLSGGIGIVRCLSAEGQRVRVAIGRNREARLPLDRVAMETGLKATSDEAEAFRHRCAGLAEGVDLTEIWELTVEDGVPLSLEDLSDLYWGSRASLEQRVALLLKLEEDTLRFEGGAPGYAPRPLEYVNDVLERRRRDAQQAKETKELAEQLAAGKAPEEATSYQRTLLEHLRGFAVHGDDYSRASVARAVVEAVGASGRDLQRTAFELLVEIGTLSPDEPLELERADIPQEFPDDVLSEARAIDPSGPLGQPGRRDLTHLDSLTIDDEGTADRDDALSVEAIATNGPSGEGVYRVGIHITEGGALVAASSAMDREADRRMATLYLPERRIPMLPPEASEAAGSLEPGETRATLSVEATVTEQGDVTEWDVFPSTIVSRAALSYEDADAAIEDSSHRWHGVLEPLHRVAQGLRSRRDAAGAVSINRPEMSVRVEASGEIRVRVLPRSAPARETVAEFMILCNSLLARFCHERGIPAAYRSQPKVDPGDLGPDAGVPPNGPLRWYMMMRRLPPAELAPAPATHGGLGVPAYVQATSPLRRYPDLVMQRQVSWWIATGEPLYSAETVASVAQRADVQLREMARLEEERRRYWFLKYLGQSLESEGGAGLLFEAMVLENPPRRSGLLELSDYPFRVRASLPPSQAPGDLVTLRLHGVDLWERVAQFVHEPASQ